GLPLVGADYPPNRIEPHQPVGEPDMLRIEEPRGRKVDAQPLILVMKPDRGLGIIQGPGKDLAIIPPADRYVLSGEAKACKDHRGWKRVVYHKIRHDEGKTIGAAEKQPSVAQPDGGGRVVLVVFQEGLVPDRGEPAFPR